MAHLYLNGHIVPADKALIPANDRAILFGDGAYETMRSYSGKFLRFPEHLRRLRLTLEGMSLELPVPDEEIMRGARELIEANGCPDARVRLTVTGGPHDGQIRLARSGLPNLIMAATPLVIPPAEVVRDGVKVILSPWPVPTHSPLPRIKTINRLMHLMAKEEAIRADAWDALFCDEEGNILEGTATNVFFVIDGVLRTSPLESPLLPGVTRDLVLEEARAGGVEVGEAPVPADEAMQASEAFLTSTTIELLPIRQIDDREIGKPGPVCRMLHARYRAAVDRELASEA
jgi:branched-chain amino acid aminotransferase